MCRRSKTVGTWLCQRTASAAYACTRCPSTQWCVSGMKPGIPRKVCLHLVWYKCQLPYLPQQFAHPSLLTLGAYALSGPLICKPAGSFCMKRGTQINWRTYQFICCTQTALFYVCLYMSNYAWSNAMTTTDRENKHIYRGLQSNSKWSWGLSHTISSYKTKTNHCSSSH
jgi:hypothetical protein